MVKFTLSLLLLCYCGSSSRVTHAAAISHDYYFVTTPRNYARYSVVPSIYKLENRKKDTVRCIMLVSDTITIPNNGWAIRSAWWTYGYQVNELHNTGEDVMDRGFMQCVDKSGKIVPCYTDYWQFTGIYLADDRKTALKYFVWMSKPINP